MTLWGDPGPTRVICQRACDTPEAICHSAFSRRWEICHYSALGAFGPLPSEAPSLVCGLSVVEMGDKKLEEFLRRNDLTNLCMVVQEFKDLMTIAPPLDICNIGPDQEGKFAILFFKMANFPGSVPGPPKRHNNDKCITEIFRSMFEQ